MRPGTDNRTPLLAETTFERTGAWTVPSQRTELDRLAEMAAQLAGTSAALLVDASHKPPEVLGAHGVDTAQAIAVLAGCATMLQGQLDTEGWLTGEPGAGHPFCYGIGCPSLTRSGNLPCCCCITKPASVLRRVLRHSSCCHNTQRTCWPSPAAVS